MSTHQQCQNQAKRKPLSLSQTTKTVKAMSLSQRLKQLQMQDETALPDVSHLRLEDLHDQPVEFGDKHLGESFRTAWKEQAWIQFMVSRYSSSRKLCHRKLIQYVELMVSRHEESGTPIRMQPTPQELGTSSQRPVVPKATMRPKAKAMPRTEVPSEAVHLSDMEAEWELGSQMSQLGYTGNPVDPDIQAMQTRLLNMENALGRVIHHLESQAFPNMTEVEEDQNAA